MDSTHSTIDNDLPEQSTPAEDLARIRALAAQDWPDVPVFTKRQMIAVLDELCRVEEQQIEFGEIIKRQGKVIEDKHTRILELKAEQERRESDVRALVAVILDDNVTDYGDICPGKMHEALERVRGWLK